MNKDWTHEERQEVYVDSFPLFSCFPSLVAIIIITTWKFPVVSPSKRHLMHRLSLQADYFTLLLKYVCVAPSGYGNSWRWRWWWRSVVRWSYRWGWWVYVWVKVTELGINVMELQRGGCRCMGVLKWCWSFKLHVTHLFQFCDAYLPWVLMYD